MPRASHNNGASFLEVEESDRPRAAALRYRTIDKGLVPFKLVMYGAMRKPPQSSALLSRQIDGCHVLQRDQEIGSRYSC